jgi:D-sedoheptulose 7-phosphate isomerase
MSDYQFINNYLEDFSRLLKPNDEIIASLIHIRDILLDAKNNRKKVLIFGNGGSSAIASHFAVDIIKNFNIQCLNCNEAAIITCFANDYGYEHWVEKAVEFHGNEGDILITISSSGSSKNMTNAVQAARCAGFASVITLSGFKINNPLSQLGDINLWVNSMSYNYVENLHQIWLLTVVDLLVSSNESNR